MQPLTPLMFLI